MTIGGEVEGTEIGEYTATFTLNDGYVWKDKDPSVREANVT